MAESKIPSLKKEIRRQIRVLRAELQKPEATGRKEAMDAQIREQVLALLSRLRAEKQIPDTVYLYASFGGETDTFQLMDALWQQNFLVALPRVAGERMDFYLVRSRKDLVPGFRNIPEPAGHCEKACCPQAVVITPGTAFTMAGDRMGYGGGFYDRFFSEEPEHKRVAVCYPFQIFSRLPVEEHDKTMDYVITGGSGMDLRVIGARAKEAASYLNGLGITEKNEGLRQAAQALLDGEEDILTANQEDVIRAAENGMSQGLIDRLELTPDRLQAMADGLLQIAGLPDPVGEVASMKPRPNGLLIGEKRVPLGVVGMIYEARPNVTSDAFGLCFKTGNAVILKGGSDAIESNKEIVKWLRTGLSRAGLPEDSLQLITDTDRAVTTEFMRLNEFVDVLIPRGGAGLIRSVVQNSTVPVIETGTGNCHIYVDETADFEMALNIIENAKTQRIGVCNACESLVVHRSIAEEFLPLLAARLAKKSVEVRADEAARGIVPEFSEATPEDWGTEYLDYILSLKLVDSLDEAIRHINRYNTGHSEAIITQDYNHAQEFLNRIDAAAVYVNASTRFTDGGEFGFGAEIGISTQKLHARGPMGLKALTTTKYIIYGNGQVRP